METSEENIVLYTTMHLQCCGDDSPVGEVPMPTYAAYGASKAALSIFSKVMRLELSVWGVKVAVIQPTGFRTSESPSTQSLPIAQTDVSLVTV